MATKKIIRKKTVPKTSALRARVSTGKTPDKGSVWPFLGFGLLFGYFLSKAGATDYDTVINMFRPQGVHIDRTPAGFAFHLEALQLYGVIGTAIAVIALGLFLLSLGKKPTLSGKPLDWEPLKWDTDRLLGALIFGAGWALSGTCPGTSLAQIGEGKLVAFFTVAGIFAGVWAYRKLRPDSTAEQVC